MMAVVRFYADLHIHSKFSRACSRDCDLEHLAWWAGRKGIGVVGTGDFTHPAWREELGAKLVPDAPGLFRLRPELERAVHETLPPACRTPVRFLLSSEISTIYKRDDRTRKVHHLLYAPSLEAVDEITRQLLRIGNLASDGRPILGLDSRNLLEIALSGGDGCYLVPAHAWTPWFAVLGSQSGFDRVADCYADLASHIFAIETGLSSDPEMNWRVSSLDQYRLVSNSDAHSPPMLGREATAFSCEADYFGIHRALRTGDGFDGTVEFFPEEGKYHLDGHRACDVRTTPAQTRAAGGKCPVCGKKPTIGVQHRVDLLADRPEGYRVPGAAGFTSFVQLPEILGEIAGVGPKSKSVTAQVTALVERFGPELSILGDVPLDDLAAGAPSIVAEAIGRLRRGDVRREAGYDGVYGTIRLFDPGELAGAALFDLPRAHRKPRAAGSGGVAGPGGGVAAEMPTGLAEDRRSDHGSDGSTASSSDALDPEQHAIVTHDGGPLLVVAGPGAGKTRVLTHAIAHRIGNGLPPEHCLAVTFTRRARDELRERLAALLGEAAAAQVTVATFHGLGLLILRDLGLEDRVDLEAPDGFDQLLTLPLALLGDDPAIAAGYRARWTDLFVDEYQDVDEQQYRLLRGLTSPDSRVCAIGDPDQAIYGFRGGDVGYFLRFQSDFGSAVTVQLSRSYRSAPTIVRAAMQLIRPGTLVPGRELVPARSDIPDGPVALRAVSDEREEAEAVAAEIDKLLGGASFHALDSRAVDGRDRAEHQLSFADFAVLYRTSAQAAAVAEALARRGFPCQRRSHARLAETAGVPQILAALGDRGMLDDRGILGDRGMLDAGAADADGLDARAVDSGLAGSAATSDAGAVSVAELLAKAVGTALSSVPAVSSVPGGPRAGVDSDRDSELKRSEAIAAIRSAADVLAPLADRCGADLGRFLDEVALGAEIDTWDPRADRITLLTLHAAKGLEFPVVFIVGCDDGLLPLRPWRGAEIDYAEERRLLFVGMTRATTRLTLLTAAKRTLRGEVTQCSPSPFLSSIDPALLDRRDVGAAGQRGRRRDRTAQQTTLF
jgi:DNA helicase-2/ATP-dependent DNA helicase PcrA